MFARPFINSLDFARNGSEMSGEVSINKMVRLLDIMVNQQGSFTYAIRGRQDEQGNSLLGLKIAGRCSLRCQRCLSAMDYAIRVETRLWLREQVSLDALDNDVASAEEDFDSILADEQLDVLNLLEDEILLSLPIAPKHEQGACQVTDGEYSQKDKENPFAILAKLKVVK